MISSSDHLAPAAFCPFIGCIITSAYYYPPCILHLSLSIFHFGVTLLDMLIVIPGFHLHIATGPDFFSLLLFFSSLLLFYVERYPSSHVLFV